MRGQEYVKKKKEFKDVQLGGRGGPHLNGQPLSHHKPSPTALATCSVGDRKRRQQPFGVIAKTLVSTKILLNTGETKKIWFTSEQGIVLASTKYKKKHANNSHACACVLSPCYFHIVCCFNFILNATRNDEKKTWSTYMKTKVFLKAQVKSQGTNKNFYG